MNANLGDLLLSLLILLFFPSLPFFFIFFSPFSDFPFLSAFFSFLGFFSFFLFFGLGLFSDSWEIDRFLSFDFSLVFSFLETFPGLTEIDLAGRRSSVEDSSSLSTRRIVLVSTGSHSFSNFRFIIFIFQENNRKNHRSEKKLKSKTIKS